MEAASDRCIVHSLGMSGAYWSKCNNGANTGSGQVIFRSLQCFLYGPMPYFLLLVAPCSARKQILQHQRRVGVGEDSVSLKWVPFPRTPGTGSLLWCVWVFRIRLLGEKKWILGWYSFQMAVNVLPAGGHNHCLLLVELKRKDLVGMR